MRAELKQYTINFKSLSQKIDSPILAGAGDTNGYTLRLLFTQEALKQFSSKTKVYFNWHHLERDIYGYNVMRQTSTDPMVWEMNWPKGMLVEGNALCRIELVDDTSIAPSNNFTVHILNNPTLESRFFDSDEYEAFSEAVLEMNAVPEKTQEILNSQKLDLSKITERVGKVEKDVTIINNTLTIKEY